MVGGGKDREEMSDLISRSEMIRAIEEHYINLTNDNVPRSIPDFYSEMQKLVYNQPTAFDTEKVVEEIKKLDLDGVSMVEDGKYKLVRKNEVISLIQTNGVCNGRQKSCKYCYKKDCPLSTEKTLSDKWSDIVKKGGVE